MTGCCSSKVRDLLDLALAKPQKAIDGATAVLAENPDEVSAIVALRARGLANRLLVRTTESYADLTEAIERAEALGDTQVWSGVAITMAGTLVYQGKPNEAKDLLNRCIASAVGLERVEALFQLGTTHAQAGELAEALELYQRVLPQIRRHKRWDWEAQLIGNRGIIRIHTGDYRAADRDLARVIELQLAQGSPAQAAINMHNRAQALYMSGDLGGSLDMYRIAEELQDELGLPVLMHAQKTEAFLAAGMFEQTLVLARRAHEFHRNTGVPLGEILSLMPGAEAALALDRFDLASDLAAAVTAIDGADAFPAWTARARLTLLEARARQGTSEPNDITLAVSLHDEVRSSDSVTAARALLVAGAMALAASQLVEAKDLLEQAHRVVQRCPLHVQVERWTLVADARYRSANRAGAIRAVRAGFRAFDALLAGLTVYDVRTRVTRHAERLAEIGVRSFLDAERVGDAIDLIEHLRSSSLQLADQTASVSPDAPRQPLRDAERAVRRGDQNTSSARLLQLQKEVAVAGQRLPPAQPESAQTLLVYIESNGELSCMVSTGERHDVVRCGKVCDIGALVEEQRFAYRQLARRGRLSARAQQSLIERARIADQALGDVLLPDDLLSDVQINPSPSTASVIWGSLPGLFERAHNVAVSQAVASRTLPTRLQRVVALGASELAHVPDEITKVAKIHQGDAHADPERNVLQLLESSDLVHLAGHFAIDGSNPLFSRVLLGPTSLRGADLLQLKAAPSLVVLSACSSGDTDDSGGAPFGFATAALAAGVSSVIVTQSTLEDSDAAVALISGLHKLLAAGHSSASALRELRVSASEADRMIASTLTAIGAGARC